jgi:PIN domain nuclease of toxin-antitoxin system
LIVSAVNLAETVNKLTREIPSAAAVRQLLAHMELTVVDWSEDMAYRSAEFTRFNKSHGLSLGDRACLTLAKQLKATAVTSDRAWRNAPALGVHIMIFR